MSGFRADTHAQHLAMSCRLHRSGAGRDGNVRRCARVAASWRCCGSPRREALTSGRSGRTRRTGATLGQRGTQGRPKAARRRSFSAAPARPRARIDRRTLALCRHSVAPLRMQHSRAATSSGGDSRPSFIPSDHVSLGATWPHARHVALTRTSRAAGHHCVGARAATADSLSAGAATALHGSSQ